ncbi:hypothetical protein NBRC116585_10030 [Thalassolituus maritimus]|uniref:Uncharacterized protein n=2 Tax=Thalassolituus maritimus TaxID=484498 RepID=A0ABP9ZXM8_9GAMM
MAKLLYEEEFAMKYVASLLLFVPVVALATPRPMMMLDDSSLSDTRVDYLTGLEKQRSGEASGDDEAAVTPKQEPDARGELPVLTPASVPTAIPLPSKGISVQITPR